jgi:ABC-2 type transport system ATP-binding protein
VPAATSHVPEPPALAGEPEPMIRMVDLGRAFGELWAVRGLNLDVHAGEVLGLLGPNGAGKTTTVRMLAALIGPTEGTAQLDGHDVVTDAEAVRSRVGVLTETPGLYEKLSATENLEFFGKLHGLDERRRREAIERLLRLLGLWDRRSEPAGQFSKGMKQKLAIARALLHDPTVLFLDEPTSALDPESAFVVREAIADLRSAGRTIVLATHNLDEADRLCDRIAFVRGGFLRVDSPARLRGDLGRFGVDVSLAPDAGSPAGTDLVGVARAVAGVTDASARNGVLSVALVDDGATPGLVRARVGAGAAIAEVRRKAATLEDVYFEVMGVTPAADTLERDR